MNKKGYRFITTILTFIRTYWLLIIILLLIYLFVIVAKP
jgi:hypothetical protein